jgi:DNA-binding HxlR family transcriptional regulator
MANSLARKFGCPVELTLELLGGKWKPVILAHLKERPLSYADLRRLIPRLSEKMLTQRLRDLQEQGLVERAHNPRTRRSFYRLTARGRSLAPVLQAMHDWGNRMAEPLGAIIASKK